jgi:hypothetical protein
MLWKKIIVVYSENHTKHINSLCGQNAELLGVKEGGKYSYHWALKNWATQMYTYNGTTRQLSYIKTLWMFMLH